MRLSSAQLDAEDSSCPESDGNETRNLDAVLAERWNRSTLSFEDLFQPTTELKKEDVENYTRYSAVQTLRRTTQQVRQGGASTAWLDVYVSGEEGCSSDGGGKLVRASVETVLRMSW